MCNIKSRSDASITCFYGSWIDEKQAIGNFFQLPVYVFHAFKHSRLHFWGVLTGEKRNAICSTSELTSATLLSKNYDIEYERCADLGTQPYMALEKDFLRFMLSDGASAVLLQDNPGNGKALKVEWVEMTSFANELPTCMFMGAESEENGDLRSWKSFSNQERIDRSLFVVNKM